MKLTALSALVAIAFSVQPAPPAPVELPAPTGRYAVGTTTWRLTDSSRRETFTASGEPRQVEVMAWYPAATQAAARAPYLREGLAEVQVFATMLRSPKGVFDGLAAVQTHASVDAAPAPGKFPVLVFSHGFTGIPSSYTSLLEDLASHGFAVLSVIHPYEASAATLDGGRVVTLLDEAGQPLGPIREIFSEWGPEDERMAEVTKTPGVEGQRRVLREYISGIRRTDAALRRWVADTKLVLDRLPSLPAGTAAEHLAARLDLGRLGAFGHSMGGVTAGQFCLDDRRCKAGLNLDGIPQSGDMLDRAMPKPFLMVYSARPGRLGASDAIYTRAARPYYRVDVPGTRHVDFSDMIFWGGPLRERSIVGTMAPARVSAITRLVVRQFFDQELRGRRDALASGLAAFPEVLVRRVPRV